MDPCLPSNPVALKRTKYRRKAPQFQSNLVCCDDFTLTTRSINILDLVRFGGYEPRPCHLCRAASERSGSNLISLTDFTWKPRPEHGLDCLICAIFTRQRSPDTNREGFQTDHGFVMERGLRIHLKSLRPRTKIAQPPRPPKTRCLLWCVSGFGFRGCRDRVGRDDAKRRDLAPLGDVPRGGRDCLGRWEHGHDRR